MGGIDLPGLLAVVIVLAVVFLPMLFVRRPHGSGPDGPGPDSDDGPGGGPRGPERPPDRPRGGIPLQDAEPARVRLRDHRRLPDLTPPRTRRPCRAPGAPVPRRIHLG